MLRGGRAASERSDLFVRGNLSTIGLGGCGIEMENPLAMGLVVEVDPFGEERLSVAGKVVNLRVLAGKPGYGIGIEFAEASGQKPTS
jgi:PilZ domain